jgi:hypothetical protein
LSSIQNAAEVNAIKFQEKQAGFGKHKLSVYEHTSAKAAKRVFEKESQTS